MKFVIGINPGCLIGSSFNIKWTCRKQVEELILNEDFLNPTELSEWLQNFWGVVAVGKTVDSRAVAPT
jgi:hypothetical protein